MKMRRAKCYECGRVVAVNPPRGGDGSADIYRWHRQTPGGVLCPASRTMVGAAEYVETDTIRG